ncbi:transcription initiation factor TFIID subunit 7 [Trifolium repens]|nr:transcription initiation factor TFIID subunit 7 [Trifolium repens]
MVEADAVEEATFFLQSPSFASSFLSLLVNYFQDSDMEEQFILRVPPNVAERIERLLNENNASSSEDKSLDLQFGEDGRSGTFVIGDEHFPASLLDLPAVVESYKTYDDNSLVKTADIGQMIMVRESGDAAPDVIECRHGLTPPMRDARKRRFRREPDLNPELVSRVEKDLLKIIAGGTAENLDVAEQEGEENARGANKKPAATPASKHDVPETHTNAGDADRSDSDESDESV